MQLLCQETKDAKLSLECVKHLQRNYSNTYAFLGEIPFCYVSILCLEVWFHPRGCLIHTEYLNNHMDFTLITICYIDSCSQLLCRKFYIGVDFMRNHPRFCYDCTSKVHMGRIFGFSPLSVCFVGLKGGVDRWSKRRVNERKQENHS